MEISKEQLANVAEHLEGKPHTGYVQFGKEGIASTDHKVLVFNSYKEGETRNNEMLIKMDDVNQLIRIANRHPDAKITLTDVALICKYEGGTFIAEATKESIKYPSWEKAFPMEEPKIKIHLNIYEMKKLVDMFFMLNTKYVTASIIAPDKTITIEGNDGSVAMLSPAVRTDNPE